MSTQLHQQSPGGNSQPVRSGQQGVHTRLDQVVERHLATRWQERVELYQLYPLLVHVALFGAAYTDRTLAALRRYV